MRQLVADEDDGDDTHAVVECPDGTWWYVIKDSEGNYFWYGNRRIGAIPTRRTARPRLAI